MKQLKVANEHQIQQALEGLTGFKCRSKDLRDYQVKLGEEDLPWRIPFLWREPRALAVRPAVIPTILNPGPRSELVKALEEVEDCPAFVMDGVGVGKMALWLVYSLPGHMSAGTEAQRWISRQVSPMLIVGTYRNEATYIGAPVGSFTQ